MGSHTQGLTTKSMPEEHSPSTTAIPNPASSRTSCRPYTQPMDRLWTPWRAQYLTGDRGSRPGVPIALNAWPGKATACVFCNMLQSVAWAKQTGMPPDEADQAAGILALEPTGFVCLNAFPYTSGHLLILPYCHTSSLAELPASTAADLMLLAQRAERWLRQAYSPDGLNLGMNLGEAAGAGIAAHLHLHILPRWAGDGNFMMTTADTRVLPETLGDTWTRLRQVIHQDATHPKLQTSTYQ